MANIFQGELKLALVWDVAKQKNYYCIFQMMDVQQSLLKVVIDFVLKN